MGLAKLQNKDYLSAQQQVGTFTWSVSACATVSMACFRMQLCTVLHISIHSIDGPSSGAIDKHKNRIFGLAAGAGDPDGRPVHREGKYVQLWRHLREKLDCKSTGAAEGLVRAQSLRAESSVL